MTKDYLLFDRSTMIYDGIKATIMMSIIIGLAWMIGNICYITNYLAPDVWESDNIRIGDYSLTSIQVLQGLIDWLQWWFDVILWFAVVILGLFIIVLIVGFIIHVIKFGKNHFPVSIDISRKGEWE